MKKALVFIVMLCLIPTLTVRATEPIMPGTFDIIIDSCEGNEELNFDLLIKPEDYLGDDFTEIDVNQVRHDFQMRFPNYQTFDFLVQGEYISYSAYIYPIFDYVTRSCRYNLETMIDDHSDLYFLVFLDDGTVVYQERFEIDDLGYKDRYQYYTSIIYDVDQNTTRLDTNRQMSIGEIFLIIIFGIAFLLMVLISIPLIIVLRRKSQH